MVTIKRELKYRRPPLIKLPVLSALSSVCYYRKEMVKKLWFICQELQNGSKIVIILLMRAFTEKLTYTLQAARSGDRIPVAEKFSASVQSGSGAHAISCKTNNGSSSRG